MNGVSPLMRVIHTMIAAALAYLVLGIAVRGISLLTRDFSTHLCGQIGRGDRPGRRRTGQRD